MREAVCGAAARGHSLAGGHPVGVIIVVQAHYVAALRAGAHAHASEGDARGVGHIHGQRGFNEVLGEARVVDAATRRGARAAQTAGSRVLPATAHVPIEIPGEKHAAVTVTVAARAREGAGGRRRAQAGAVDALVLL